MIPEWVREKEMAFARSLPAYLAESPDPESFSVTSTPNFGILLRWSLPFSQCVIAWRFGLLIAPVYQVYQSLSRSVMKDGTQQPAFSHLTWFKIMRARWMSWPK